MKRSESAIFDLAVQALDSFQIEIPSWGFANTGTRFGKFLQPAAATCQYSVSFADRTILGRSRHQMFGGRSRNAPCWYRRLP